MRSVRARLVALAAGLIVVLVVALIATRGSGDAGYSLDSVRVNGTREADGVPFVLDGDLYLPDGGGKAPAVLLAHGWGGSKDAVAEQAKGLARRGFVVLAYSARGFGRSGGKTHLDSPDYEVKDARLMLDYLAKRPEVQQDAPGDPRVGVTGASYGGALALLLAGVDHRVDALVPSITWNNLPQALFPQFAGTGRQLTPAAVKPIANPGVFKKQWMAVLIGGAVASGGTDPNLPEPAFTPSSAAVPSSAASPSPSATENPQVFGLQTLSRACGRLDPGLCLGYIQAATTGRPGADLLKLLAASSPSRVASQITAPTLLIQGENDSLFPLSPPRAPGGPRPPLGRAGPPPPEPRCRWCGRRAAMTAARRTSATPMT